jgi:hypothetical protein
MDVDAAGWGVLEERLSEPLRLRMLDPKANVLDFEGLCRGTNVALFAVGARLPEEVGGEKVVEVAGENTFEDSKEFRFASVDVGDKAILGDLALDNRRPRRPKKELLCDIDADVSEGWSDCSGLLVSVVLPLAPWKTEGKGAFDFDGDIFELDCAPLANDIVVVDGREVDGFAEKIELVMDSGGPNAVEG